MLFYKYSQKNIIWNGVLYINAVKSILKIFFSIKLSKLAVHYL